MLVLTRYGRLSPTTRVRFLQFIENLERDDGSSLRFDIAPLLEDHCLQQFYDDGTRNSVYLLKRYLKRARLLLACKRYDLVWIEKELFPALPALAERILRARGVTTIVDYDDAAYAWYHHHPSWLIRTVLGRKIEVVCRASDTVVAGNPTLAAFASAAGARDVVVVPSAINIEKYSQAMEHRPSPNRSEFVVGWIGTPSNVRYLDIFKDALTDMASTTDFKFLTIGAPGHLFDSVAQEAHPWSEGTEAGLLARCDCTVAPLSDGDFERGKCGFKVIQGMAAGLPVVASPVGVVRDIIQHGKNGFLAETASDCRQVLQQLRHDPDLRLRVGRAARRTVTSLYSDGAVNCLLRDVFRDALGNAAAPTSKLAHSTD